MDVHSSHPALSGVSHARGDSGKLAKWAAHCLLCLLHTGTTTMTTTCSPQEQLRVRLLGRRLPGQVLRSWGAQEQRGGHSLTPAFPLLSPRPDQLRAKVEARGPMTPGLLLTQSCQPSQGLHTGERAWVLQVS